MELYPSLSFDCFDRLFPNQDIMPEGGFGNLIALPLQFSPRQLGNSVFIDKEGLPYSDQWAKLASIEKMSPAQLSKHLTELVKASSLIDEETSGDSNHKPWQRSETSKSSQREIIKVANCPEKITLILANQVYVPISNLPGKITSSLKRCAVFANPEFFKRQTLRFSTIGTSRYICSAHIESDYLILPRGCLADIENILSQQNIAIEHDDKRFEGESLSKIKFNGKLKNQQTKAVTALLEKDNGVFVASTGFGKTVTGLALVAKRKINTLILVHNRQLAEQWLERIKVFLTNIEVGSLLGGKDKLSYQVDVATYQSLVSRNGLDIKPAIEKYGQIIIDECHHLPASNYEALIKSAHARYVHGLTATPKRQDGLEKLMHFQLGGVVFKATTSTHKFEQHVKVTNTRIGFPKSWEVPEQKPHISEVYKYLMLNQQRNQLIIKAVVDSVNNNRTIMILTERKEHITILADMLASEGVNVIELHGSISAKQRQQRIEKLRQHDPSTNTSGNNRFVILATGKYVGEGFDLSYLDTLFITLPIAWKGILAQYAGRIQREWSTKEVIQVYDFVDDYITLKRMWAKREKGYKALGYTFDEQRSFDLN
jgi:superfamily II DNA or RNA helicase